MERSMEIVMSAVNKSSIQNQNEKPNIHEGHKNNYLMKPVIKVKSNGEAEINLKVEPGHEKNTTMRQLSEMNKKIVIDNSKETNLQRHMRAVATGVKRYNCFKCGKFQFITSENALAQIHMNTCHRGISSVHEGQKEDFKRKPASANRIHKCYICSEIVGSVISLKIHLKHRHEHKNMVPKYQCLICGEVFIEENSYHLHMHIHKTSAGIPNSIHHLCNFCRTTYSSNQNLQIHISTVHTYKKYE